MTVRKKQNSILSINQKKMCFSPGKNCGKFCQGNTSILWRGNTIRSVIYSCKLKAVSIFLGPGCNSIQFHLLQDSQLALFHLQSTWNIWKKWICMVVYDGLKKNYCINTISMCKKASLGNLNDTL